MKMYLDITLRLVPTQEIGMHADHQQEHSGFLFTVSSRCKNAFSKWKDTSQKGTGFTYLNDHSSLQRLPIHRVHPVQGTTPWLNVILNI
jgi:hypothetical protein